MPYFKRWMDDWTTSANARHELVITIEENGDQTLLATDGAKAFLECGTVVTRRASHVEPVNVPLRVAFYILRACVSDKHAVARWTRGWNCLWRVNTAPVDGPILKWRDTDDWRKEVWPDLPAAWAVRQDAIDAEIKFLNKYFGERTI